MRPLPALILCLLACAAPPTPASAAPAGGGLYEPFPEARSKKEAKRFVEQLGQGGSALRAQLRLSRRELDHGVFLAASARGGELDPLVAPLEPGLASARAEAGSARGSVALAAVAVLVLASGGLLAVLRLRAAWPAVAALVAAVALAGAYLGGDPSDAETAEAAPLPSDFFGIVSDDVYTGAPAYRERTLGRQRAAGVGILRRVFDWAEIEQSPGRYSLGGYDQLMVALARRGIRVLPVLLNTPAFHSSAPAGTSDGAYPPRDPAAMARFADALVRRYGPRGSLWRERPDVEPLPIRSWQVWNEPNLALFWPAGPDAKEYAALLKATSSAIKRADPEAEVVLAGLPNSRFSVPLHRYIAGLYRAGAGGAFDVLAVHPYAPHPRGVLTKIASARNVMDRYGDRSPIWVTEIGWADDGPHSAFTVGPHGQAERIERSFAELVARRHALGLRGVVYYNWRDERPYRGGNDFFGYHTGLLTLEGRPKPALRAFSRATRRP